MKIENIKFKAKRLDNSEWVEGSFVLMNIPALSKTTIGIVASGGATLHEVDPSTVCQFTGLKDCKGNEIWEGDILKNYPMENEVVFRNGSFMIIEDYDDEINEVPLSEITYEDGICILEKIDSKFDRKEGEK